MPGIPPVLRGLVVVERGLHTDHALIAVEQRHQALGDRVCRLTQERLDPRAVLRPVCGSKGQSRLLTSLVHFTVDITALTAGVEDICHVYTTRNSIGVFLETREPMRRTGLTAENQIKPGDATAIRNQALTRAAPGPVGDRRDFAVEIRREQVHRS